MQLYCIDLKDAIYFAAIGIAASKRLMMIVNPDGLGGGIFKQRNIFYCKSVSFNSIVMIAVLKTYHLKRRIDEEIVENSCLWNHSIGSRRCGLGGVQKT
jgi:hypothetical protein